MLTATATPTGIDVHVHVDDDPAVFLDRLRNWQMIEAKRDTWAGNGVARTTPGPDVAWSTMTLTVTGDDVEGPGFRNLPAGERRPAAELVAAAVDHLTLPPSG